MNRHPNFLIYFLQTWGIILVVLGHAHYQYMDAPVVTWMYSFHMPLFMFISGYLLAYSKKPLTAISLKKKAHRLILPYVAIGTLVFIPKVLASSLAVRPVELSAASFIDQLICPYHHVIGSYWFLPTLFLIFVIVKAAALAWKRETSCWLLMAVLIPLNLFLSPDHEQPLNIYGVLHYLAYVALGYYTEKHQADRLIVSHRRWLLPLTFLLSLLLLQMPAVGNTELVTALNGIVMSIALGGFYLNSRMHFLDHLYGATYYIYLLSWFPQVACNQLILQLCPGLHWTVTTGLSFAAGLYMPWLVYKTSTRLKQDILHHSAA